MSNFKKEQRYTVIKTKDIEAYLDDRQKDGLGAICEHIIDMRCIDGKADIQAVVVEHDWPMYEETWKAIERYVTSGVYKPSQRENDELKAMVNELRKGIKEVRDVAEEDWLFDMLQGILNKAHYQSLSDHDETLSLQVAEKVREACITAATEVSETSPYIVEAVKEMRNIDLSEVIKGEYRRN